MGFLFIPGDNVIIGSYDKKLCWFDNDLSTKPYKTLRCVFLSHWFADMCLCIQTVFQAKINVSYVIISSLQLSSGEGGGGSIWIYSPFKWKVKWSWVIRALGSILLVWYPSEPWNDEVGWPVPFFVSGLSVSDTFLCPFQRRALFVPNSKRIVYRIAKYQVTDAFGSTLQVRYHLYSHHCEEGLSVLFLPFYLQLCSR